MAIWAIADLHLSFGVPNKSMTPFGPQWENHPEKIAEAWKKNITNEDLVLIAGDQSWAMKLHEVEPDLAWIDALPGTKVMIRGNHDYWWGSYSKVKSVLPPSIHAIQNNAFHWNDISIAGARLWDTEEFSFSSVIDFQENAISKLPKPLSDDERAKQEKIYLRELSRLEMSLKALDPNASKRVVMTHYPPIGHTLESSRASLLMEQYGVNTVVFGHLHNLKRGIPHNLKRGIPHSVKRRIPLFGKKNGINYFLTSCDCLDFCPLQIG